MFRKILVFLVCCGLVSLFATALKAQSPDSTAPQRKTITVPEGTLAKYQVQGKSKGMIISFGPIRTLWEDVPWDDKSIYVAVVLPEKYFPNNGDLKISIRRKTNLDSIVSSDPSKYSYASANEQMLKMREKQKKEERVSIKNADLSLMIGFEDAIILNVGNAYLALQPKSKRSMDTAPNKSQSFKPTHDQATIDTAFWPHWTQSPEPKKDSSTQ